jgi:hypothetical protein
MVFPLCVSLSYSSDFLETLDEASFFTTSPAVTRSLMLTPTFSQGTPHISNPASATDSHNTEHTTGRHSHHVRGRPHCMHDG